MSDEVSSARRVADCIGGSKGRNDRFGSEGTRTVLHEDDGLGIWQDVLLPWEAVAEDRAK